MWLFLEHGNIKPMEIEDSFEYPHVDANVHVHEMVFRMLQY